MNHESKKDLSLLEKYEQNEKTEKKHIIILIIISFFAMLVSGFFYVKELKKPKEQKPTTSVIVEFCEFVKNAKDIDPKEIRPVPLDPDFCDKVIQHKDMYPLFEAVYNANKSIHPTINSPIEFFYIASITMFISGLLFFFFMRSNIYFQLDLNDDEIWTYEWIASLKKSGKLKNMEDFNEWMTMPERYSARELEIMKLAILKGK